MSNHIFSSRLLILFCFFLLLSGIVQAKDTDKETIKTTKIDLKEIKTRGVLRILVPSNLEGGLFLPRYGSPVNQQQEVARKFSDHLGLKSTVVPVFSIKEMFSALSNGRGDIIAANITITPKRKKYLNFSLPIEHVHEVLLGSSNNKQLTKKSLNGKTLLVNPSTSFWETAQALKKRYPKLQIIKQNDSLQDEEALDLISSGEYDFTIRDSNISTMYLSYRNDIKIIRRFKNEKAIAWGLRLNAPNLKEALDTYLTSIKLSKIHNESSFGDLDAIKKRGVLRVLLKNNSASYFFWRGQLMGFEYEMAKAYAKHLGVKLAVIVPPNNSLMLSWLKEGRADFAAGFLTYNESWLDHKLVASTPYHSATQHLVVNKNNNAIKTPSDLKSLTVVIHRSSQYWTTLKQLQSTGIKIILKLAPEEISVEEILEKVASGEYPATLVDEHLLGIELNSGAKLKSAFSLDKIYNHSLAIREGNTTLLKSLNDYIKKKKESKHYRTLYNKYFINEKSISLLQKSRLKEVNGKKRLSRYDKLVKKYSQRYGFDWRLITAQMYSESRFQEDAHSHAGAIGLMQVMKNTGKQLNLNALHKPDVNIHAGVKYMHWLSKRFNPELPIADRMWFTLASYNAGLGHVLDAKRLAEKQGLNPNRWFDNVEKAMLMLSKRQYYQKSRYGYVRGREPVGYVRKIKALYENYLNIVKEQIAVTPQ
ncbi:MAG: transporter substrate-binding domain-containing protein [Thiotrichaceae bacterium]|nr:transporter substrate-binding domain-containing protein [Thiotrichaceae bacterium]